MYSREELTPFLHHYVEIEREAYPKEKITCIPLKVSDQYLLALELRDFFVDGYIVIRRVDITDCIYNQTNIFFEKVIKSEGLFEYDYQIVEDIPLDSLQLILGFLMNKNYIVELNDDYESSLIIGRLMKINKESVVIQSFNTICEWEDKVDIINVQEITSIGFLDRYSITLNKYLPTLE